MNLEGSFQHARAVADALLYEGYLLYPYRASAAKNQLRWQFGVLGPPGAADAGIGEESSISAESLLVRPAAGCAVTVHVRFLQLQSRTAEALDEDGYRPVAELAIDGQRWLTWDEAVEVEPVLGPFLVDELSHAVTAPIVVPGGKDVEPLRDRSGTTIGRLVRERRPITADLLLRSTPGPDATTLSMRLTNTCDPVSDRRSAEVASLIGAHLLVRIDGGEFVSLADPPERLRAAADACHRDRWWPALAGSSDQSTVLLVSPIIVEDHAQLAPESRGALFDSTEIDEILTLRVITMTEEEKAEARATDRRAAEIIDSCDALSADEQERLHGTFRDPGPDSVLVAGTLVKKGSLVTVRPNRRADAHDMFFQGMVAQVAAVVHDVDGATHVAVTLVDDPAADLHDWYGRYLYFAPDELDVRARSGSPSNDELIKKGEDR